MKMRYMLIVSMVALGMSTQENICETIKNAYKKLTDFKTAESKHKEDWLNFIKKQHDKKIDLVISQMKDWVALSNKNIEHLGSKESITKDELNTLFSDKLDAAIKLQKQHTEQWKKLMKDAEQQAKELSEKNDKELMNFEKGLRPEPEVKKAEKGQEKAQENIEEYEEIDEDEE